MTTQAWKWQEIAADLRGQIAQGVLRPGGRAPAEWELAERWGVARGTARQALMALEQAGVLSPGKPRRVARYEPLVVHVTRAADRLWAGEEATMGADSWLADAHAAGRKPSQLVDVGITIPGLDVVRRLELATGMTVITRRNTRLAGEQPHNVITFWFPADIADGTLLTEPGSIAEGSVAWLEKTYGKLTHEIRLGGRMPDPAETELLHILPGVPVLIVWRTSRCQDRVLVTSMATYPADRTELVLGL
jgi:GntR family transcriptional regulator